MSRPCYQAGRCVVDDPSCSIRDRVIANSLVGRPPATWHLPFLRTTTTKGGRADGFRITEHIDPIKEDEL